MEPLSQIYVIPELNFHTRATCSYCVTGHQRSKNPRGLPEGDRTCSDYYTVEVDTGQLDRDSRPQRCATFLGRAEHRHRLTCAMWPYNHVALHNEQAFKIFGFDDKGAEVVGSRWFPVDGVDKHEAPMVPDRDRRQDI